MTRGEKLLTLFLALLVAAFTAEHIILFVDFQRHPPQLVEACPVPKPK